MEHHDRQQLNFHTEHMSDKQAALLQAQHSYYARNRNVQTIICGSITFITARYDINAGTDDLAVSWSDDSSILHLAHKPQ